ncbi:SpaH/EbpB family LPXTG-anchored major pilin [Bacillus pacificus]|uniref:SpaH/EbpB family LPXTG-anchored major pilin n=1 Tax=Bacillus TaxID=1386 RepID=UPI000347CAE8|nr:SpaH/EbpB family LPXTG-anchored major pilin [Bacillus pacificus]MCC2414896.1 SpaH/EbpB family LPXTG-anchored major pilin [Bacillus pacificus]MCU5005164.1 SpaH/EbpB family LPXTG-anchored major pilin [Bacillus pacificus]MCU5257709.1 SpaH/EbpB family LPXTG-anchored major pilin [Bacillus pacificus]MCU5559227.1 SpaH/EbpB family LPXTG-anchored major pilin [Bacillus pacificus]HDR3520454.1 SpaH/EbpB family LPXTG-anchored major pilin [Bacillus pacificus]
MKRIFSLLLICVLAVSTLMNMTVSAESRSTGTLTIHKYEKDKDAKPGVEGNGKEGQSVPDGAKPLKDVTFEIKRIASFEKSSDGKEIMKELTDSPITKVTDDKGEAVFSNLPLGRYEVKAIKAPDRIELDKTKFIVDIPMTSADGKDLNYDVHIYPKNETKRGSVELIKKGEGGRVLEGAEFHLFKKNEDGTHTQVKTPHPLVSGTDGKIHVESLEYGDYYFIEEKAPKGYITSKQEYPFSIREKDIPVKLEKDVVNFKEPTIEKTINDDSKNAGINRETEYTYDIKTLLPEDIQTYKNYVVTDVLDDRLEIVGTPVVTIDGKKVADSTVNVIVAGQKVIASIEDFSKVTGKELHLQITAKIRSNVESGVKIPNKAVLDFVNKDDVTSEKDGKPSNEVIVTPTMGTIKIEKVDGKDKSLKLEGARFELRDKKGNVVTVNKKKMDDITDANGIITWNEIPYGEYQIVETVAPKYKGKDGAVEQYQKLRDPIDIKIDKDKNVIDLQVENNKSGWIIPATGGMGTILFTVVGLLLMVTAAFIFFRKKPVKNS